MKKMFGLIAIIFLNSGIPFSMLNPKFNEMMLNTNVTTQASYEVFVKAPIDKIFPLTCPVREYDWIGGWKCNLIHCPNGHVVEGCIFSEIMSAPMLLGKHYGKTTWTAIRNDTVNYKRHYKLDNQISSTILKIEMYPLAESKTKIRFEMKYVGKKEKAKLLINKDLSEKLRFLMSTLGKMLKFYCENDAIMPASEIIKYSRTATCFSFSDKCNMILNKIAISVTWDRNRKRYLKGKPISVMR